jgi:3-methyladenine DNA glycosylase Mpg
MQAPGVIESWFDALAEKLLNGVYLRVDGISHRLVEIEFYLRSADHPDPFTHGRPLQQQYGRWYFHRTGGSFRNGSFKGLDLTLGDGTVYLGVLFRGLETPEGDLIDGPSLLVDYLLLQTKATTVRELDSLIAGRLAWDACNPLVLEESEQPRSQPLFRSARIGLTLKNAHNKPEATSYIQRPYRYLTEPRRIAKGKALLVLALHANGADVEEIHDLTGSPRKSIRRYIDEFAAGRVAADC